MWRSLPGTMPTRRGQRERKQSRQKARTSETKGKGKGGGQGYGPASGCEKCWWNPSRRELPERKQILATEVPNEVARKAKWRWSYD